VNILNLEIDKELSVEDTIKRSEVVVDNLLTDDPRQWTGLYNSHVTSEEMELLLSLNRDTVTKNDNPQNSLSHSETPEIDFPENKKAHNLSIPLSFNQAIQQKLELAKENFAGFTVDDYKNGKTVTNNKYSFPKENYKASDIRSSLLIPERHLALFRTKIREHGGVRAYIVYLLSKYRIHISNGLVPAYSDLTTKYQEKGQGLVKIGFRPNPADWAELKLYRVSFGMSISAFLIYLLIVDSTDFARTLSYFLWTVGIPASKNLDLAAKLYLCQNRHYFTAIFQFRESRYD
jgi:hypothetical protein